MQPETAEVRPIFQVPSKWRLYVIADRQAADGRPLEEAVLSAIRGGADAIQLRDKKASDDELIETARSLLKITRPAGVPLLINDRPTVAKAAWADGVHLGQDDGSLERARAILGPCAIYGRSTHSPKQALLAQDEGFDYIGVGPVFATPTKPGVAPVGLECVRFASESLRIPFVAIGGVDASTLRQVLDAGARAVAVVRAVIAANDPESAAQTLLKQFP